MNEDTNRPQPPFEITLPQGKTYEDLNQAHQDDAEDGGDREENLYPTRQAQLDNSESYVSEMTLAETRELVNSLKSRLEALKDDGKSEFNEGIIRKEEELSVEVTKEYVDRINRQRKKSDIDAWLYFAEKSLEAKEITDAQFQEIQEVSTNKISELSVEVTKEYVDRINRQRKKSDIDAWLYFAEKSLEAKEITDAQFQEIQIAAKNMNTEINENIETT